MSTSPPGTPLPKRADNGYDGVSMKVAIVHYWLVGMRGGEKVLESLLELFPEADVFTHVYDRGAVSPFIRGRRVFTSSVQRLPFARRLYQKYMPLMPNALLEFDLRDYDLVISSEAGPAKGVVANPDAYHFCYCHSPARYLWDMYHEYGRRASWVSRVFMRILTPGLRVWDVTSANLVDRFVANSRYVAQRIKRYYHRDALVIYPPAEIEKYLDVERRPADFYLFCGQLVGYKRADLAIEACVKAGRKLVVAGGGARARDAARDAKSGLVTFLGRVSDERLKGLYAEARALLFPGIEDLGLVPVEANAAGCPVIAYRKGGALDTVKEHVTGMFFDEQTADSLADAIMRFEDMRGQFDDRAAFTGHVRQFSKEVFRERINEVVAARLRV
jgi:glycosyltransferase involved in cell wall biosynthesis